MSASKKTITPMPPSRIITLRHSSMQWLKDSTFVRMVAPVVVKPETDSKNASR